MPQSLTSYVLNDILFDDNTDLDTIGINAEEYCHRIAANLPMRPHGLCLAMPKPLLLDTQAQQIDLSTSYTFSQRAWVLPSLCLTLFHLSLLLVAIRVPSIWLLLPALLGGLVFIWTLKHLQSTKLWATPLGLHLGATATPSTPIFPWYQLVGIDLSSDWSGKTLTLMHHAGPDYSLRISHLANPMQIKVQLEYHLLQLAAQARL